MKILDETMIRINDVKQALRNKFYTDRRYKLIDTSGPNASGDSFDLVEQVKTLEHFKNELDEIVISDYCWKTVRKIASSHGTSMPNVRNKIGGIGAYGATFNRTDIAEVLI